MALTTESFHDLPHFQPGQSVKVANDLAAVQAARDADAAREYRRQVELSLGPVTVPDRWYPDVDAYNEHVGTLVAEFTKRGYVVETDTTKVAALISGIATYTTYQLEVGSGEDRQILRAPYIRVGDAPGQPIDYRWGKGLTAVEMEALYVSLIRREQVDRLMAERLELIRQDAERRRREAEEFEANRPEARIERLEAKLAEQAEKIAELEAGTGEADPC